MAGRKNPPAPKFTGAKFLGTATKKFSKFTINLSKRVKKK